MTAGARGRFRKSARTSASLCALFLIVYGGTNWFTGIRPQIPSVYFRWERHIPFMPATILPYMSIDLFFIASPFIVASDRQRRTLAARISAAILIAGACFLLIPLKFAFERPHVNGPLGLIFNNFRSLDLPFNQFPSLHIALCAILADAYHRNLKGFLRQIVAAWMILIALSPLLTWQHHLIDIFGGLALAVFCFHFFRDQPLRQAFLPNPRVGAYYTAGAIVLAALAFSFRPWSFLLFYPAFSAGCIAAAYFFLGPGIYRKTNGRHARTTSLVLGPVLLGQRLSLTYYSLRCRPRDRVSHHLSIGRQLSFVEARAATAAGITAVLDLTAEFSEPAAFLEVNYLNLPILDLTAPTPAQFDRAIAFIQHYSATGVVYVHCKAGYSRTAAVAGAYLLATESVSTVEEAIDRLRHARPSLVMRPEALLALRQFHATRCPATAVAAD